MADDKSNAGARDRTTAEAGQDYEVAYFAKRHNITTEQARELIQLHGNNRGALEEAAERLGTGPGSSTSDLA